MSDTVGAITFGPKGEEPHCLGSSWSIPLKQLNIGKPAVTAAACTHCPHDSGMVFLTHPPQYAQVCCRCGENLPARPEPPRTYGIPPGHGPFYPRGL